MTTPRIEEIAGEVWRSIKGEWEEKDGKLPSCWTGIGSAYGSYSRLIEALTQAHQAGIDKAVEKIEKEIEGKLETWAALEHSRWSKWQEYLHSKLYEIDDNRVSANSHLKILPTELWQRWERQIMTAYSDLSEAEKESDRKQVRPYIEDLKRTIKALQDNK